MIADLVSVDPGKDALGLAFWLRGRLVRAGRFPVGDFPIAAGVLRVVVERPRARHANATPGGVRGHQAIVDVALSGGLAAGRFGGELATFFPDEWKGSTSKRAPGTYVVELRCRGLLTAEEVALVELPRAKGRHHDVWDAVGIGLFALGRAGRGVTRR